MTDQQQYVLTLQLGRKCLQYELTANDGYTTVTSSDPGYIVRVLRTAFAMSEEEAAAAVANAITRSETYTIYKGMEGALPAMVLLHAWGVGVMRLAVYHRGRCRQEDGRPIMMRRLEEGYPEAPLVCPNCGKTIEKQWALAFSFVLEA